jgi:murein DD-endopeptidase MepM/ murein hydrolase activator NlpD
MSPNLVIVLSALTMLLPLLFIRWLWRAKEGDRTIRLLRLLVTASVVSFFYFVGMWGFYSYYLRYFMLAFFVIAAFRAYARRIKRHPVKASRESIEARIVFLIILVALNAFAISGYFYSGKPVELSFPLEDGAYYVIQGGNSRITNPFHWRYKTINAVDIVKLNLWGNRAAGLFPRELSRYAVFGETVHSPCTGKVSEAVDGLPDLVPHDIDLKHPMGNHVVIQCEGVSVLLAHMKNGSVSVRKGDRVKEGQPIGRVGNSGNTFEPHLHIHAVRSRDGSLRGPSVPLLFNGRYLSLNSLVRSGGG